MNTMLSKILHHCTFLLMLVVLSVATLHNRADADDSHGHGEKHDEEQGFSRGPNGGRLLIDGDFTLELAIVERGVPPEYRAWASLDGETIAPEDWQLNIQLTRLGGQVDQFSFAPEGDFLRSKDVVREPHSFDVAVTASYQDQKYHWAFPSHEGRVQLTSAVVQHSELTTAVAGAGILQRQLKLFGQVTADPEQVRELTARFPGVIRSVKARLGDQVQAGDVLASVEANESLRSYNITAPIAGMVVARHANEGESTGDKPLFTLADYRQLIANISVFPQDAAIVKVGQPVLITGTFITDTVDKVQGTIEALIPASGSAPTINARVMIDNAQQRWTPGEWISAYVTIAEIPAPLLIDNRALQRFRDWQVVFIQVGDTYEIRPLELGQTDGRFTEVLGGLKAGDTYVVENSYLLKADLEKSGASHDH